jgi:hypothetical protein
VVLVASTLTWSEGGFSSLAGVELLFSNPWMLLAAWTHYLAFDLFVGGWEVRDAQRRGIPDLLIKPALVLTFLLVPAGVLFYLAANGVKQLSDEANDVEPVGHNQRVGKVPGDQRTVGGRQIHTDDANLLFAFELMKIAGSGGSLRPSTTS